jgi:hypothetical protein
LVNEIKNYDYWEDGQDFRPSNPNFCEKCNQKGTYIKEVINEEKGTTSLVVIDCECKKEYITKLRLKEAGIHPQYHDLNASLELSEGKKNFIDKFYICYKDPKKVSKNLLITGSNKNSKTKFLALFAKRILYKSMNIRFKYITLSDLLISINKVWKNDDYSAIEDLQKYDFLIIDKVEMALPYLKQNMNSVVLVNLFETRDQNQKPTIISCATETDIELLNLDLERFVVKDFSCE